MMQVGARHLTPALAVPEADIHLLKAEEAGGVARLMHEVYGDTYPKKYVYDPEQIHRKIASGEIVPVVATSQDGKILGYIALSSYYGYADLGLVGSLSVSPACRGQGLGGRIASHMISCARGGEFCALTGGAFTAHPYSQWAMERLGFTPSAILLGSQPGNISFRNIAEELGQRESTVFYSKALTVEEYAFQYLPDHHRDIIRGISRELGIRIVADGTGHPGDEPAVIEHSLNTDTGAGMIWMRKAGHGYRDALGEVISGLSAGGAKVLRLHLDLNDPGSTDAVTFAEEAGFVFSGILPRQNGFILILQHLLDVRIDTRRIQVGSPSGERLLSYISRRAGGNGPAKYARQERDLNQG